MKKPSKYDEPSNRWGCSPKEDVCLFHCAPLDCRHGCDKAKPHQCKEHGGFYTPKPVVCSGKCNVVCICK